MRACSSLMLVVAALSSGCTSTPGDEWDHLAELKAMRGRTRWHRAAVDAEQRYHELQIRAYRGSVETQRFRVHCEGRPKIRELNVPYTINAGRHATIDLGAEGLRIVRVEFLGQAVDKWANLDVYGRRVRSPND